MRPEELKALLHTLLSNWEDEVVEFKRGGKGFSTGEIGEYFSALANEANLRRQPHIYPAVYGRMHWDRPAPTITGGQTGVDRGALEALKIEFRQTPYDLVTRR